MNDLKTIQKMNSLPGVAKLRARALAMNSSQPHQKKASCKRLILVDQITGAPTGASQGLDRLRKACNLVR